MKSPSEIRSDITVLSNHVVDIRRKLEKNAETDLANIGKECRRTAETLTKLLEENVLPDTYKVAVVGRFKAGKSAFVNELLDLKLAGEDTNPETAAVTTFRHGERTKATIEFLSLEDWQKIGKLYEDDPRHVDAHRIVKWHELAKTNQAKPESERSDFAAIENDLARPGGHRIEIEMDSEDPRGAEVQFRRRLREFTTGARPSHCFVRSIEIEAPAPILDGGVHLIDTPGLGDTEKYRVDLTEKVVDDVDAVLFLTRSGASYDQMEKDFLLTLLRKGTVKQLIVVVTQVDVTYQQHLDNAENNDEDPSTVNQRIELEHARLMKELSDTLEELARDESTAVQRYRDQLGEVQIAFTTAKVHRDWKAGKHTELKITEDDPGGVQALKSQLLALLSTESRLALAAQSIAAGTRHALLDLESILDSKLESMRTIRDTEVAEQKLRDFRDQFAEASSRFEKGVGTQLDLLKERLLDREHQQEVIFENIVLHAEKEMHNFEKNDVGRHWRSRRSGYWGYMTDFQGRVANRIFPKVQTLLNEYTDRFLEFADNFEKQVNILSNDSQRIVHQLELDTTIPFDVGEKLNRSFEKSLGRAQDLIVQNEQQINSILSDFVDEEVSERISNARSSVSGVWGRGTTIGQANEIAEFYKQVRILLSDALRAYLKKSAKKFSGFLAKEAATAPRDAIAEVNLLIEQSEDNIRLAATTMLAGQKQAVEDLVHSIKNDHAEALRLADDLMVEDVPEVEEVQAQPAPSIAADVKEPVEIEAPKAPVAQDEQVEPPQQSEPELSGDAYVDLNMIALSDDWADIVQEKATHTLERIRMSEGGKSWNMARVFPVEYLKGAVRIKLIDAYLFKSHQLRNLGEFLIHVAESIRPKEITILTKTPDADSAARQEAQIDRYARQLFSDYGVSLNVEHDVAVHDRFVVLDNGVLFKLGRGLDFYKPALGLAGSRPELRITKQNEVDIFSVNGALN